uniref:Uncharacterized protein n=1 Tax=Anguilla anguilla TaxID=7936 RepID=A0A0E9QLB6_ANGAN
MLMYICFCLIKTKIALVCVCFLQKSENISGAIMSLRLVKMGLNKPKRMKYLKGNIV